MRKNCLEQDLRHDSLMTPDTPSLGRLDQVRTQWLGVRRRAGEGKPRRPDGRSASSMPGQLCEKGDSEALLRRREGSLDVSHEQIEHTPSGQFAGT